VLKEKYIQAILFFSISLAFKMQAFLLAPLFLILLIRGRVRLQWLLITPAVIFVSIVPAWMAGRALIELLGIYINQTQAFNFLSMNAPNPYFFINFIATEQETYKTILIGGLCLTAVVLIVYLWVRWKKWVKDNSTALCFDAAFLTLFIPYLLPKMHERYFFPATLFLLILVFYHWQAITSAILIQVTVLLSFLTYLNEWTGYWVELSAVINLGLLILFVEQFVYFHLNKNPPLETDILNKANLTFFL
jgi:Gpi18-like mannosyltransferase